MSQILLEEDNPYGNASAFVEADGRTVYLYRVSPEGSLIAPAAVWVRNLLPAPENTDDAPTRGVAPLLKRSGCAHPEGAEVPRPEDMDLIWFPDGTGVTLTINGEVEAILPPWAGRDSVQGYAKDALGYESATLPLPPSGSGLHERLEENRRFWNLRTRKGDWENYRDGILHWYESFLGPHTEYFAVDNRVPLLGIARFESQEGTVFATVGMGRQPQPGIELYRDDPELVERTEILCRYSNAPDWLPSVLGSVASYPWRTGRFLDTGHIYESGREDPLCDFLFTDKGKEARWPASLFPSEPPLLDERVRLRPLFAVPASKKDVQIARAKGVDHCLKRMSESA